MWRKGALLFLLSFFFLPLLAEETSILVDMELPEIIIMRPENGETISTDHPILELELMDQGSGINAENIILTIDGIDVSTELEIESKDTDNIGPARIWRVIYRPSIPLKSGEHLVQIDVQDNAGNRFRKQWSFFVQAEEKETDWDIDLINNLSYSHLPLSKMKNTSTLYTGYRHKDQSLSLRLQTSVTDHPGMELEPVFGDYYLHLDNYILGWRNRDYTVQYGNINLPFESALLHYGLAFKGISVDREGLDRKWKLFQGTTARSSGLGLSVMNTSGGIYSWKKGTASKQFYFLDIGKDDSRKVLGFQDRFILPQGIVNYELNYGQDSYGEHGGAFYFQGAASIFDVFLDSDFSIYQASFPLSDMAVMSSTRGGAYRYKISGSRILMDDIQLACTYSRQENNLENKEMLSTKRQSIQIDCSGFFSPDFKWLLGYQGGIENSYDRSEQQIFKISFAREYEQGSLRNNFRYTENNSGGRGDSCSFQYSIVYNRKFPAVGLDTNSIIQYTGIDKSGKSEDRMELRISAEKDWFSDLLKSRLVLSYKKYREKNEMFSTPERDILGLETYLNIRVNEDNSLKFNAGVTLWEKESSGRDYRFSFSWNSRIF